ncbi:helix-turn-helix transcriptional regulator [Georgenia yuyongxinii]|uniref:Helix-turn-helix transcriptional regulator n=1 Tax=Georgenia yuyongxinii TaxID=2589797 RepID=A0A5B8C4H4_9MICO|nr:LuxR family transcriptional regulator [Georgenia yuyongxinii]QDC25067.1 helix-turn-helix transcriptional regulator [Georgenia yuyongxinii]
MSRDELLVQARAAHAGRRWVTAFDAFQGAERAAPLEPEDLGRMAECAHLLHRMDDYFAVRGLAYQRYLDSGNPVGAAVSAFWLGAQYLHEGEVARGTGWMQRAFRIAATREDDERLRGYLSFARTFPAAGAGDLDGAARLAVEAVETAQRCDDTDLTALALHQAGILHLRAGRIDQGRALLDEAMVVVTADHASPMVTGIVYCGVIAGCWSVYDIGRAHEWTDALAGWCAAQPELGSFVGECRVRRAELRQLHGDWAVAAAELDGMEDDVDRVSAALALYVRGDLQRLQGRWDEAERSFVAAARLGQEPQPGLALLRLARGSTQAAAAMVRRSLTEVSGPRRVAVVAAAIEILLSIGDADGATAAGEELDRLAARHDSDVVRALAAQARAHLAIGAGHPEQAGEPARTALETWLRVGALYEEARARSLLGTACRALGDVESAAREERTARDIFERLGARPDLDALDHHARQTLSAREVEVLRLVATGATNRAIAAELVLSERTVDRHVSNILTKLGVATRAAATARAGEWQLL